MLSARRGSKQQIQDTATLTGFVGMALEPVVDHVHVSEDDSSFEPVSGFPTWVHYDFYVDIVGDLLRDQPGVARDLCRLTESQVAALGLEYLLLASLVPEVDDQRAALFGVALTSSKVELSTTIEQTFDTVRGLAGYIRAHPRAEACRSRLKRLRASLEMLAERSDAAELALQHAVNQYRIFVQETDKYYYPANLEVAGARDLRDLFVAPRIANTNGNICDLASLVDAHRAVVLGDPGGGKSTLTKQLLIELTASLRQRQYSSASIPLIPFAVVMRDFERYQSQHHEADIPQYVSSTLRSQCSVEFPADSIEYLFKTGRGMAIFDGLDELLKPAVRSRLSKLILGFATTYPGAPVVVTSRRVGYSAAALPVERFSHFELLDFDQPRVEQYTRKWFTSIETVARARDPIETAADFLNETTALADIRGNPLLLTMLCTVYRSKGTIPRTRPEIYRLCAEHLYVSWDASRGIEQEMTRRGLFETHLAPVVSQLALWIAKSPSRLNGVEERKLRAELVVVLSDLLYTDRLAAQEAAEEMLALFRGRSWVLSEVGLSIDGERLYRFTHQTFLEYFAAKAIAGDSDLASDLVNSVEVSLNNPLWESVSGIAMQIWATDRRNGAAKLCEEILRRLDRQPPNAELANFAAGALRWILPHERITGELVARILELTGPTDAPNVLRNLLSVHPEILPATREALAHYVVRTSPSDLDAVVSVLGATTVSAIPDVQTHGISDSTGLRVRAVLATVSAHLGGSSDALVARCAIGELEVLEIAAKYGIRFLVKGIPPRMVPLIQPLFLPGDYDWSEAAASVWQSLIEVFLAEAGIPGHPMNERQDGDVREDDFHLWRPEPTQRPDPLHNRRPTFVLHDGALPLAAHAGKYRLWLLAATVFREMVVEEGPVQVRRRSHDGAPGARSAGDASAFAAEWRRKELGMISEGSPDLALPIDQAELLSTLPEFGEYLIDGAALGLSSLGAWDTPAGRLAGHAWPLSRT